MIQVNIKHWWKYCSMVLFEEFRTGIHSVNIRNVSVQRCNIHYHKLDFGWNCFTAYEFVDEFCGVFDVVWKNCIRRWRTELIKPETFSLNVPMPDMVSLPSEKIYEFFVKPVTMHLL